MVSLKKKITYEKLLYLVLLISPFLDVTGFLFRQFFPDASFSLATVIRPLIPVGLLLYIFIKEKNLRIIMLVLAFIYALYGFGHMFLYKEIITGISYGSFLHELQYIVNYTFMIGVLFIFYYGYKHYKLEKLPKIAFVTLTFYVCLIYLSIITNTSSNTYIIEGIGYKGWFASGNAIGSILLLLFCVSLPYIQQQKNKTIGLIIFLLLSFFLMSLLGTRTGLFGFILCVVSFVGANLFVKIIRKVDIKKYKKELIILGIVMVLVSTVFLIGSKTFERKQNLEDMSNSIMDPYTKEVSHVSGDTLKIIDGIRNNNFEPDYMSDAQEKAMMELYDYANKKELKLTNRRVLQMVYHLFLMKNQNNINYILFGNGYLANYSEFVFEMEIPAILFNFGIIGFVLYLLPFICIYGWSIKIFFNNLKKVDVSHIMYLVATTLAFALSFLAGYTFFNISSMTIIVMVHTLLIKKNQRMCYK